MESDAKNGMPSFWKKVRTIILGNPKQIKDPSVFHRLSLIPILAWVGLGADGLSSSAYGPEEAFRALGGHTYLSLLLACATALTVFIISYAYSRIIEHFPHGGGGYIVATHMLGEKAGVISGCALLVDYILTITISIASCADAIFSYLPTSSLEFKVSFACALIVLLIVLNYRGVKESITVLTPIFMVFVLTHIIMLLYAVLTHTGEVGPFLHDFRTNLHHDYSTMGGLAVLMIFLRAYSLGGGTYTGIEAVSNGLQILREPRVHTGKRTMLYMAASLAFTAGVLVLCYSLLNLKPEEGRTLNSVLADTVFNGWPMGSWIAFITIFSEGALLLVAAQTGFVDGPRVMANMAIDHWFPHRFAALSEQLTMKNGIFLMGASAIALLFYTHGSVSSLVVMYSINVFLTFSLSELGMSYFFITHRSTEQKWKQHLSVHLTGLTLCATILVVTTYEKFAEGGWITLLITFIVIMGCYLIRGHYRKIQKEIKKLDDTLLNLPIGEILCHDLPNPENPTAIQLVSGYNGFGVHTLLSIQKNFPYTFKNIVFVSVAVINSGAFKGVKEIEELEKSVRHGLQKYAKLARSLGFCTSYRMAVATDVVDSAVAICSEVSREFPRSTVFTGQLTFSLQRFYHKMLHNETAFAIQRRLQETGTATVILPIQVDA